MKTPKLRGIACRLAERAASRVIDAMLIGRAPMHAWLQACVCCLVVPVLWTSFRSETLSLNRVQAMT